MSLGEPDASFTEFIYLIHEQPELLSRIIVVIRICDGKMREDAIGFNTRQSACLNDLFCLRAVRLKAYPSHSGVELYVDLACLALCQSLI